MALLDGLLKELGPMAVANIASQIQATPQQTEAALPVALATILGSLAHNSRSPSGAQSLWSAVDEDHDGSALNDVQGFLGQDTLGQIGGAILGHVLGGQQKNVETEIASSTGLDMSAVTKLLPIIAPLVMAYLSKQKQSQGLDVGGLAGILLGEQVRLKENKPANMGMLGSILDQDGDGDVSDDVAALGVSLLGKLFS